MGGPLSELCSEGMIGEFMKALVSWDVHRTAEAWCFYRAVHAELLRRLSAGEAAAAEVARLKAALGEAIELAEDVADTSYAQNSSVYRHKLAALKAALEEKE